MSTLQPHQQRVIDEKLELDAKAKALSNFIGLSATFQSLDHDEQERMKVQNDIMWQYSEILGARITAFSRKELTEQEQEDRRAFDFYYDHREIGAAEFSAWLAGIKYARRMKFVTKIGAPEYNPLPKL